MKERRGAVQLGERTNKKFLTGILPEGFKETVFEDDTHWSCEVEGKYLGDKLFDDLFEKIKSEFGNNLAEVYSLTSGGVHFVVYLRKSNE